MELNEEQERQRLALLAATKVLGDALWDAKEWAGELSKAMYAVRETIMTEEEKHPPPLNPDFCWATSGTM